MTLHIRFPTKDSVKQGYEDGLKGMVKSIGEHDPVDHKYHDAWELGDYHRKQHDAKKKYGEGHDMAHHGEGKPQRWQDKGHEPDTRKRTWKD